jgi:hypothetical protein
MPKYKIFRDETYVFYLEADSWEAAREMADDQVCDERELISVHYEVILIWNVDYDINADDHRGDEFSMVTILTCPKCDSMVEVFYPVEW